MAQPIVEYISEELLFEKTVAAIKARDELNQLKEMRRLWANVQRTEANRVDKDTNLAVAEYNEVQPLPKDLHPVEPIDPADDEDEK